MIAYQHFHEPPHFRPILAENIKKHIKPGSDNRYKAFILISFPYVNCIRAVRTVYGRLCSRGPRRGPFRGFACCLSELNAAWQGYKLPYNFRRGNDFQLKLRTWVHLPLRHQISPKVGLLAAFFGENWPVKSAD